jgi:hypothetical protein
MPKIPPTRRVRPQNLTVERRARADRVREQGREMTFRYKRYKEKNLCYFVNTATGHYASYISMKAKCSLFVTKEE